MRSGAAWMSRRRPGSLSPWAKLRSRLLRSSTLPNPQNHLRHGKTGGERTEVARKLQRLHQG